MQHPDQAAHDAPEITEHIQRRGGPQPPRNRQTVLLGTDAPAGPAAGPSHIAVGARAPDSHIHISATRESVTAFPGPALGSDLHLTQGKTDAQLRFSAAACTWAAIGLGITLGLALLFGVARMSAKAEQAAVYEAIKAEVRERVDAMVKVAMDVNLDRIVKDEVHRAVKRSLGTLISTRSHSVDRKVEAAIGREVQRLMMGVKVEITIPEAK